MFRCVRAPTEPQFPTSLHPWGYHKNEKGEFINTATGQYFDFFHTDNERVNDIRRGAYQEALRTEIAAELKLQHNITELYLSGERGVEMGLERPGERHVSLLTTEVGQLKGKRDVVVIVGESMQDCGVWAWRVVQREGGVGGGSLVGLARKLAARGGEAGVSAVAQLSLNEKACASREDHDAPGIIVLNPGQLLYSYNMGKNVSMPTWQSRPRPTAISESYKIEPRYNFIPGHENPHQHIQTVFTHILPQLITSKARLHLITIGDGSTPTIELLDRVLLKRPDMNIGGGVVQSVALIAPTHEHDAITSPHLTTFLATAGKSWVQSAEPKGTKLLMPESAFLGLPALEYAPSATAVPITAPTTAGAAAATTEPPSASASQDRLSLQNVANNIDDNSPTPVPPNTPAASVPASPHVTFPSPHPLPIPTISEETEEEEEEEEEKEDEDEYPPLPVSSPTYSAGVCDGVTETVLPAVMDDVVEYVWWNIAFARNEEKSVTARMEAKGVAWPRDAGI